MSTTTVGRQQRPTRSTPSRPPARTTVAALLTLLMSALGAYGAIYFTGLEGWDDLGITYATTYEYIAVTGFVSALALLRGHSLGRVGVAWYAAFQVVFTTCKLATIQEVAAIPFGVAGLVVLGLLLRPFVRGSLPREVGER